MASRPRDDGGVPRGSRSATPRPAIVVTGASGFVGRHLLEDLRADYRIFAIARRSQRECGAPVDPNIAWMRVDIGDREDVARAFREIKSAGGARALLHMAAYYDFTGEPHPEYARTNVEGTRNILQLSRQLQLDRFIFASSVAACDFPRTDGPVRERTPPDGRHVYAWSKREGERLTWEAADLRRCVVRFGAVFSDWCEYPPLYMFLRTWLGRAWRARVLPGRGGMAIPYVHVRDLVQCLRRLLERERQLGPAEALIASTSGATSLRDLYGLAMRHYFGHPRSPIGMPAPLCGVGLLLMHLAGSAVGRRPFERPWMRHYIDQRLEVDNAETRSLLGWSPNPRYHIEKRFPFVIERLRSEPMEWHARNQAALRRDADRPQLRLYNSLIEVEALVIERMEQLLGSAAGDALPHYRALDPTELRWLLRLLYRLLLTSIQVSNRMLILNYLEVTCVERFRAGFDPEEIRQFLRELNRTILAVLAERQDLKGLEQLLYEQVTVPFEFGIDEVQDQYERFQQGAESPADLARPATEHGPTARELIEQTIWSCLVHRK